MTTTTLHIGCFVSFDHHNYGPRFGVVVKINRFVHCPGANRFTALCMVAGAPMLVTFDRYSVTAIERGDRGAALAAARAGYLAHLREYPVWARQLDAGVDPTADWVESLGFRVTERAADLVAAVAS